MDAVTAKGVTPASNSPKDIAAAIASINTISEAIYFKMYATDPNGVLEEYINDTLNRTISGKYYLHDNIGLPGTGSGDSYIQTPLGSMYYTNHSWNIQLTVNIYYTINSRLSIKNYLNIGNILSLPASYASSSTYYICII